MAAKRKRRPARRRPAGAGRFTLRLITGQEYVFENDEAMAGLAKKWARITSQRKRWSSDEAAVGRRRRMALDDLRSMTLVEGSVPSDDQLKQLAAASVVEVELPAARADGGWPLRIFPWEIFLGEIARYFGQHSPLIVRCLAEAPACRSPAPPRGTWSALFVDGSPGAFKGLYTYDDEWRLFREHMCIDRPAADAAAEPVAWIRPERRSDPRAADLADWVRDLKPRYVHLAGFDAHEGAKALGLTYDRRREDGYYVRDAQGAEVVLDMRELATALSPTRARGYPDLVCFAIHNAGARLCPETVGRRAGAALGMIDQLDDSTVEQFYGSFYRAMHHSAADVLASFRYAIRETSRTPGSLRGAGIALWGEGSFLAALDDDPANWRAALDRRGAEIDRSVDQGRSDKLAKLRQSLTVAGASPSELGGVGGTGTGAGGSAPRLLRVDLEPLPRLNYGRLHNGCSLFASFVLGREGPARVGGWAVEDIQVQVDLHVGANDFQYRGTFDLAEGKENLDITSHIHVPLTWEYMRTMKESVQSTIFTRVSQAGRVVHERTYPVRLLPVNEWSDTDDDRIFLASFVLPSDPAVAEIISAAQRYLGAFGDPSAGFDGYQSVRLRPRLKGDPTRRKLVREDVSGVDHQVGAIWHALLEDFGLKYVNPPPTYSDSSQRLRTPSRVLREGRGTCIDLALLFAACLEYVEIHPVLFLMTGHAFAGYWRSETAFDRFHDVTLPDVILDAEPLERDADEVPANNPADQGAPDWAITPLRYDEIMSRVWKEHLAPIETVFLTDRQPLWSAWDAGIEDLESREEFDVMIQLVKARRDPGMKATPIPYEGAL